MTRTLGLLGVVVASLAIMMVLTVPVYGASLTFAPAGAQLDNDPILDIATAPGALLAFRVRFDTIGLLAGRIDGLVYDLRFDREELEFVGCVKAAGNPFVFVSCSDFAPPSNLVRGSHIDPFGQLVGFVYPLDVITFRVLSGLKNDGERDLWFDSVHVLTVIDQPQLTLNEVSVQPVDQAPNLILLVVGLAMLGGLFEYRRGSSPTVGNH